MPEDYELYVLKDKETLTHRALQQFFSLVESTVIANGGFSVALAGGSTPKMLYEQIAAEKDRIKDWSKVHIFFGDERFVPHDHAESNFKMAHEALLQHIPEANVYLMPTDTTPEEAAQSYAETLHRVLGESYTNDLPRFNLILLGLGMDGHTASLFPHTAALNVTDALVTANHVEKLESSDAGGDRLTLTLPVINNAANVTFMVAGEDKASALFEVLHGEHNPEKYPAQMVKLTNGSLAWLVDDAAAEQLPDGEQN